MRTAPTRAFGLSRPQRLKAPNTLLQPCGTLLAWMSGALLIGAPLKAEAQLQQQPAPFTIRFDVNGLLAERSPSSLPLWVQSSAVQRYPKDASQPPRTVIRLHLRKLGGFAPCVELRVGLTPGPGSASAVAWSETGREIARSEKFGSETHPVTEVLRLPVDGADYLELELPGDGSRLSELFATAMRYAQVLQPIDFAAKPVSDAFGNTTSLVPPPDRDTYLWSRVNAPLEAGSFPVTADATAGVDFEILTPPECALITFEMRGALAGSPILGWMNDEELPAASPSLPDFADPAWKLLPARGAEPERMVYSGWLRTQQYVPGALLKKGGNRLELACGTPDASGEIRRLEIQLRYRR